MLEQETAPMTEQETKRRLMGWIAGLIFIAVVFFFFTYDEVRLMMAGLAAGVLALCWLSDRLRLYKGPPPYDPHA